MTLTVRSGCQEYKSHVLFARGTGTNVKNDKQACGYCENMCSELKTAVTCCAIDQHGVINQTSCGSNSAILW